MRLGAEKHFIVSKGPHWLPSDVSHLVGPQGHFQSGISADACKLRKSCKHYAQLLEGQKKLAQLAKADWNLQMPKPLEVPELAHMLT